MGYIDDLLLTTMNEKQDLLPVDAGRRGERRPEFWKKATAGLIVLFMLHFLLHFTHHVWELYGGEDTNLCPQPDVLKPKEQSELHEQLGKHYETANFKRRAVDWLSGAVRVPTESYDKMDPPGVDPRWDAFGKFHEYLESAFPAVHSNLERTKVNSWGLVYVWEGSNKDLKPLMLAAHQDVVPVDPKTTEEWTHPPYSGHFDGKRIWGRGSSDDKSGLIGVMSTIETLLENSFKPTRTIVLAFGFDEEASGVFGAAQLGKHLLGRFGENSMVMVVDEGGSYAESYGRVFANVGVAEKGYLDVRVDVSSPGGHSSIPPSHTSIGMLAGLLVQYESHPVQPRLARGTPIYGFNLCIAEHGGPQFPSILRRLLKRSVRSDRALRAAERILLRDRNMHALVGTTQAIDLIQGGVKTNALPEQAYAVVNHRIATDSSIETVMQHDTALLKPVAEAYNLSYTAFGKELISSTTSAPKAGSLVLTDAWGTALAPAPVTPTGGDEALAYRILGGTIRATYQGTPKISGPHLADDIVVAPGIMSGNTDTRYYWGLTPNIFRYNHHFAGNGNALKGVHTVDESMLLDTFLGMIRFFTTLILNADEVGSI